MFHRKRKHFGHLDHISTTRESGVEMDPVKMESERSMSLLQFMENEDLVPNLEKEMKRTIAINKLKQIVLEWAERVAYEHEFPRSCIRAASATILLYGSCDLCVHNNESNLDALCIGPCFATLADFFVVLRKMLARRPEVSEILCIEDVEVPLMRFKFDGISIDLPYAKIDTIFVPKNVHDPFFLANIDEISWRSSSGFRVNKSILHLVPNFKVYQSLLCSIRFWAKRRGIYSSVLGYFGGVHLAVLAAFVCRMHPYSHLSALVSIFFQKFADWPWPKPVILEDGVKPLKSENSLIGKNTMPIQLPCSANEYCYCGITRSTFNRVVKEFKRGYALTKDLMLPDFDWKVLFEPFSYAKKYERFLKICLSSDYENELEEWVGWVKSRFQFLLFKLEELVEFCDPNPTEYIDSYYIGLGPHVVFYWGLLPGTSDDGINVESITKHFMKIIRKGYKGPVGGIVLRVVKASEFPKTKTNRRSN